jgi:predicted methyltransferase
LREREASELARLGFQHRVWSKETTDLLKRAGFSPGHTVLDIGCGPGYLSADLSALVGPEGQIMAVRIWLTGASLPVTTSRNTMRIGPVYQRIRRPFLPRRQSL